MAAVIGYLLALETTTTPAALKCSAIMIIEHPLELAVELVALGSGSIIEQAITTGTGVELVVTDERFLVRKCRFGTDHPLNRSAMLRQK